MATPSKFYITFLIALVVAASFTSKAEAARAFFVFGDSLVDNGNNNYLFTIARADAPPYGIDFPTKSPTGRFSNGYNIPDLISQKLGAPPTLPYLSPQLDGDNLLVGANFASAGVGILPDTGIQFVNIIRIEQQLRYFKEYQERVSAKFGVEKMQQLVKESLVLITIGGNDFVNNYFLLPVTARRLQYNLPAYTTFLITEYKQILLRLYQLGARRVLVTGTGPLGCVPAELAFRSTDGRCAPELQQAAALYNPKLVEMIRVLNKELRCPDCFVAANAMEMQNDFFSNPQAFGFKTSKIACCGQGPYNGVGLCTRFSTLCDNRNDYVFWDAFHPTEKANRLIVETIFTGSAKYMPAVNLSTIIVMDSKSPGHLN